MRSTLDTYRDQLAAELAELRAQVCQTKTGEPSRCPRISSRDSGELTSGLSGATVPLRHLAELGPLADYAVEGHASLESEKRKLLQALQEDNEKCESSSCYSRFKQSTHGLSLTRNLSCRASGCVQLEEGTRHCRG